ncbi:Ammonium Transporter family protein [Candida parapsilosis]|uniref:Ammonium Transporter family protein n=1 Tax=Candida parapsilosis TaxID=5480 RepID=A0A8X7NPK8_CANPA|nr:Ammonium Transporter family protein [Candida parapsilosis]
MASVGAESVNLDVSINSLYLLLCTGLLPLVIIGIALFYSGLTQRRSAFTMLSVPVLISPIIILDWYIWGYSLCYATASNKYIGSLKYAVLRQLKHSAKRHTLILGGQS